MKPNYIILRSPMAVAPDPFRGPAPLPTAAAGNESQRNINPEFEIAVAEGIISVAAGG